MVEVFDDELLASADAPDGNPWLDAVLAKFDPAVRDAMTVSNVTPLGAHVALALSNPGTANAVFRAVRGLGVNSPVRVYHGNSAEDARRGYPPHHLEVLELPFDRFADFNAVVCAALMTEDVPLASEIEEVSGGAVTRFDSVIELVEAAD